MRLTRTMAALTLLTSVGLLAGCGGDDSDDSKGDASSAGSPSATSTKSSKPSTPLPTPEGSVICDVDVELTGEFEASWTGDGVAVAAEGQASYAAQHDEIVLTAISSGADGGGLVSLINGTDAYSIQLGTEGVDIDAEGGGATIDADAPMGGSQQVVHVTATFDC